MLRTEKKVVLGIMLTLLLVSIFTLAFSIQPVRAGPRTWTVDDDGPADFYTIQGAVDAASSGDTIYVYNGTYYENTYITKSLTIVGENRSTTIVDGGSHLPPIDIVGCSVNLSGFTAQHSSWGGSYGAGGGIVLWGAQPCNISDNLVLDSRWGIVAYYGQKHIISGNTVKNTNQGIVFDNSGNNTVFGNVVSEGVQAGSDPPYGIQIYDSGSIFNLITGNIVANISYTGIRATSAARNTIVGNTVSNTSEGISASYQSSLNTITGNTLSNNTIGVDIWDGNDNTVVDNSISASTECGIWLEGSYNNRIIGNTLSDNFYGINMGTSHDNEVSDNTVASCTNEGIMLGSSFSNAVTNNTITYSNIAIYLGGNSYSNSISENTATSNAWGLWLVDSGGNEADDNRIINDGGGILVIGADSSGNIIRGNTIMNTIDVQSAIFMYTCSNNTIYHNNFVENALPQVFNYASVNTWDHGYPSGGNYWSDYAGGDANEDGIGDTPYTIDSDNIDHYPLMRPWAQPWGDWSHYHNYTEIARTLIYLNETYPGIVDVFSIGKSWQDRDIYCIRLTNESNTHSKPQLFFVGYHHARELISAELALYFTVEAATEYGTNENITRILNNSEIYIVPALNVDGFDAVKQNEWQRKNAHPLDEDGDGRLDEDPPSDTDGDGSVSHLYFWNGTYYRDITYEGIDTDADGNLDWVGGVDINRNYGYQWNATCDSGSPYVWAEDYRGPAPFSEPETRAIRDLALQHSFKYAISLHSGSEVILYPWAYTTDPTPDDVVFRQVASNLSALTGSPYAQSGAGLYTSSGSWDDWMYGNRSTLALTCEIYTNGSAWQYKPGPDPDTWWESGVFQFFNPDASQIEPVIRRWLPVFTYTADRAIAERVYLYDVATTNVVPLKNVVGQGNTIDVNVTVANQGDFAESFTVTLYANTNAISSRAVSVAFGNSMTITFTWNTTGFAYGNYTISAYAWPVPNETDTADNNFTGGIIYVGIPGDVDANHIVNMLDLYYIALNYGKTAPYPTTQTANCDVDDNDIINMLDLYITALHYGQSNP